MRPLVLFTSLVAAMVAHAEPPDVLARFSAEPSVRVLQRAAARQAEVRPALVASWLARVRKAALLPAVKVRVGRGVGALQVVRGADGIDHYATTSSDAWRFEVETDFTLDRLVFDRNELRLSREAQRIGARREELLTEIAHLYFARRRLQVEAALDPTQSQATAIDRALQIDELTGVLDGLTDGALSRGSP